MQSPAPKTPVLFDFTPYQLANIAVKTGLISFAVSFITQPMHSFLSHQQMTAVSTPKAFVFRNVYQGFMSFAIAGQKRGMIAVTARQSQHFLEEKKESDLVLYKSPWFFTGLFSQLDIVVSNSFKTKAKLENVKIFTAENFKWSPQAWFQLTTGNWGSRSISGLINYAALGVIGEYCSTLYKSDHEVVNKFLGGVSAGVLATLFTTIPDHYSDRKVLRTKIVDRTIQNYSSLSMFRDMAHAVESHGLKTILIDFIKKHYLKELMIRGPITALTFGIVFAGDAIIDSEPLKFLK